MLLPMLNENQRQTVIEAIKENNQIALAYKEWMDAMRVAEEKREAFFKLADIKPENMLATLNCDNDDNRFDDMDLTTGINL